MHLNHQHHREAGRDLFSDAQLASVALAQVDQFFGNAGEGTESVFSADYLNTFQQELFLHLKELALAPNMWGGEPQIELTPDALEACFEKTYRAHAHEMMPHLFSDAVVSVLQRMRRQPALRIHPETNRANKSGTAELSGALMTVPRSQVAAVFGQHEAA